MSKKQNPSLKYLLRLWRGVQLYWDGLVDQDILLSTRNNETPKVCRILEVGEKGRVKVLYYKQEVWEELNPADVIVVCSPDARDYNALITGPKNEDEVWPSNQRKEINYVKGYRSIFPDEDEEEEEE